MSQVQSIFQIPISKYFGSEYIDMYNDMARFLIIQVAIQIMLYSMDGQRFPFFSTDFLILLTFIVIGVMLYWLVFKKLVSFT